METVSDRLKEALNGRSIRWLASELKKSGVRGASYGSLYGYIKRGRSPSPDLLGAIADVLGLRRSWLILGEGPRSGQTTSVPTSTLVGGAQVGAWAELLGQLDPMTRAAYTAIPELEGLSPAVTSMFVEALGRYAGSGRGFRQTPDRLQALAKELWSLVRYPLGKRGFRKSIEGRAETDYLVTMIQALMLALPVESPRGPPGKWGKKKAP
jgi:hypothetical protein